MHRCYICKNLAVCKTDMREGAEGPIFAPVCEPCYTPSVAKDKAEAKRFGYRCKSKPWASMEDAAVCFHPEQVA